MRVLGEAAVRFNWQVHAYVVMRNHFHLAIQLSEPNLSLGMKWLQGTWIRRYNMLRRVVGRPFQGRYKALLTQGGENFARVCHYIHLNPYRAGLVPAEKGGDYAWSSLAVWTSGQGPDWLNPSTVLLAAGGLSATAKGWEAYEGWLALMVEQDKDKKELHSSKLSSGWCVGSPEFRSEMIKLAKDKGQDLLAGHFSGMEPKAYAELREKQWEEALVCFAKAAAVNLEKLPIKKSAPEKALLAALLKQCSSVSNEWLARRLGMGQPASASQFARRYRLSAENESVFQVVLSKVKT